MRNNIDDKIKNLLNKEESIPMSVRNKKEEAFNIIRDMESKDTKNKRSLFTKKSIAVATVVIVGGITLTSPILANVKDLILNGSDKLIINDNKVLLPAGELYDAWYYNYYSDGNTLSNEEINYEKLVHKIENMHIELVKKGDEYIQVKDDKLKQALNLDINRDKEYMNLYLNFKIKNESGVREVMIKPWTDGIINIFVRYTEAGYGEIDEEYIGYSKELLNYIKEITNYIEIDENSINDIESVNYFYIDYASGEKIENTDGQISDTDLGYIKNIIRDKNISISDHIQNSIELSFNMKNGKTIKGAISIIDDEILVGDRMYKIESKKLLLNNKPNL